MSDHSTRAYKELWGGVGVTFETVLAEVTTAKICKHARHLNIAKWTSHHSTKSDLANFCRIAKQSISQL